MEKTSHDLLDPIFKKLARSSFRTRFQLSGKEQEYLRGHGMETILQHAAQFIDKRLAPAHPANDGKQTPFRNHPVFVAQHATATCCRACLEKWHGIASGRELTREEKQYILSVLRRWLEGQETG